MTPVHQRDNKCHSQY